MDLDKVCTAIKNEDLKSLKKYKVNGFKINEKYGPPMGCVSLNI
jgi:hypothetical protein